MLEPEEVREYKIPQKRVFKPGDKVRCVVASWPLVLHEVYTIEDVKGCFWRWDASLILLKDGPRNPVKSRRVEEKPIDGYWMDYRFDHVREIWFDTEGHKLVALGDIICENFSHEQDKEFPMMGMRKKTEK